MLLICSLNNHDAVADKVFEKETHTLQNKHFTIQTQIYMCTDVLCSPKKAQFERKLVDTNIEC